MGSKLKQPRRVKSLRHMIDWSVVTNHEKDHVEEDRECVLCTLPKNYLHFPLIYCCACRIKNVVFENISKNPQIRSCSADATD